MGPSTRHIPAQTHINCIVIFGNIPVDVIEAAVAHLHIDLAEEEPGQERYEGKYNPLRVPFQKAQRGLGNNPGSNVPMRRPSALILRLHDILVHREKRIALHATQEATDTTNQEVHMEGEDIGSGKDARQIRLQEKERAWGSATPRALW